MKTREEVDALKASWLKDPCFDLFCYPEFEEHHAELAAFQRSKQAEWAASYEANLPINNGRMAAYPHVFQNEDACSAEFGLTKREMFAAMAMQGFLAHQENRDLRPERIASWSVQSADALLRELAKPQEVKP